MHDAYDIFQLLKLTVHVDSIAAYDENLFVGSKQGHLLIYSVTKEINESKHNVQLLCFHKNFSKKPIQQLDVIPAYHVLISLSDNAVSFHNIHKISTQAGTTLNSTVLAKTRGATTFSLDITNQKSLTGEVSCVVRLCVAVKRKIQIYYWKNGEFHDLDTDITVPDVPKTVLLCQQTVVLGFKSEYALYNLTGKSFEKLFLIGSAPEPLITRIDDEVFVLSRGTECVVMNSTGAALQKQCIKWAELPSCIVYDKPFVIGVLPEQLEIRTIDPNLFIQNIQCGRGHLVTRATAGLVYIANATHVWCLQGVPPHQQIKSLMEKKQFELALQVAKDCDEDECEEEKNKKTQSIQTLYAFHLYTSKLYKESTDQFLTLGTNPSDVINLFQDFLASSTPKKSNSDTEAALSALHDYLTEVRRDLSNQKQPALISIIDTTLLKCYLQTNEAMIAPLLRLNCVHFSEAEKVLKEKNKIGELVILYQTNKYHSKALTLLKQQGRLEKTVEYLQHIGAENMSLIIEFAEWVIIENPEEGMKIFMEDTPEIEQLPRPQILIWILKFAKDQAISYLEHAMEIWNDTNPILHTTLADLYREKYQNLQKVPESRQEALKIREKLIAFLEKSDFYTPQTVLDLFPRDDMLEERAIMLGKQGRHEQALSIYVCLLEDVQRAKQYCHRVCANKSRGHEEVYVLLMRILISPPESWLLGVVSSPPAATTRDITTAVEILRENPDKIDPAQALSVLPDDVRLKELEGFLYSSLHEKLAARHEAQIMKGLVYSEHLQVHEQRMRSEARPLLVTEQDTCVLCRKRFTNQSVFASIPAGIAHYGCLKDRSTT